MSFTQYIFCFLIQLQDTDTTSGESEVKFQVSRDTLAAMLRSMTYIREQLSNAVRISNLLGNTFFFFFLSKVIDFLTLKLDYVITFLLILIRNKYILCMMNE